MSNGYWRVLTVNTEVSPSSSESPTPRTSHAAMMDNFGRMWVVGGETFAKKTR